jgi:hypothetical protein
MKKKETKDGTKTVALKSKNKKKAIEKAIKNANPLFWIGIAVLVCLFFLTVITAMDFKRDSSPPVRRDFAAAGVPAYNAAGSMNLSICPNCSNTGIPQCFYCGSLMHWDMYRGTYFCGSCGRFGRPFCPNCRTPMNQAYSTGGYQQNFSGGNGFNGAVAMQNVAMTPPPRCIACPNLGQCFPNVAAPTPAGFQMAGFVRGTGSALCLGCGYSMAKNPGIPANSLVCPQCGNRMSTRG